MFKLASKYSSASAPDCARRSPQLFVYTWFGEPRGARFDAGLVNPNGTPRKAFAIVRKNAARAPLTQRDLAPAPTAHTAVRAAADDVDRRLPRRHPAAVRRHAALGSGPWSTSTPTPRPARRRRCARRWPRPRSATSRSTTTRRSTRCASGSPTCSATRRRCSCPAARCATRSAFRLHIGPGGRRGGAAPHVAPDHRRGRRPGRRSPAPCCARSRASAGCSTPTRCARTCGRRDRYMPRSRLVSLEQTTNIAGGRVWPLEQMRSVIAVAREAGMRAHLDGARLMNAVVASGVPARDYAEPVRHRLARLHEGARRAGRRRAGRVARADRRGVALQADVGRLAPPGGDHRRGRAVRARPPRRPAGRGPRERAGARRGPGRDPGHRARPDAGRDEHRRLRRTATRRPCAPSSSARACTMGAVGPRTVRAVTHLDVDRATSTPRSPPSAARSIKQTERSSGTRTRQAPPSSLGAQRPGDDRPRRRGALLASGCC